MCVVSMITRYGKENIWPDPRWQFTIPPSPTFIPNNPAVIPPALTEEIRKIREYLELIAKAKETDRVTGQPDCEEPDKVKWMSDLEDRLARLEETVNKLAGRP